MRCLDCKVDLEENHKNCPLCSSKAVVSNQGIVLLTAPYPQCHRTEGRRLSRRRSH